MEKRKPSLLWALAALIIPIGVILYGTVWVGVRPPVLPLLAALALAAIMCPSDIPGQNCRKACSRPSDASRSPSPS